jgi:hypothetical protein
MKSWLLNHPFVAFDGDGEVLGRFSTPRCAARSVLMLQGRKGKVQYADKSLVGGIATLAYHDCMSLLAQPEARSRSNDQSAI